MGTDYASHRIQDALRLAKGDVLKAREQLIEWAHQDAKLLWGLAEPHLTGIAAYSIEQALSPQGSIAKNSDKKRTKTGKGTDFGLGILKAAVSSRAEIFGLESPQPGGKEKEASQEHIDAIRKLAKKPTKTRP